MSIRKLLGTGACMVIIGVSAGVSYGQFQRLTAQVAPTPVAAQASPSQSQNLTPAAESAAGRAEFVTASTTLWTAAKTSGVTAPELIRPVAFVQPEPPLQEFETINPHNQSRSLPVLSTRTVASLDPIVEETAPAPVQTLAAVEPETPQTPVLRKAPVAVSPAEKLGFAVASHNKTPPGTIRRFRTQVETAGQGISRGESNRDQDGVFEAVFPPSQILARTPRASRPGIRASTRAAQRQARFQRVWSTGVYR